MQKSPPKQGFGGIWPQIWPPRPRLSLQNLPGEFELILTKNFDILFPEMAYQDIRSLNAIPDYAFCYEKKDPF